MWYLVMRDQVLKLAYYPHRGYVAMSVAPNSTGPWTALPVVEFGASQMKKRKIAEGAGAGGAKSLAPPESRLFGKLPCLISHCCEVCYDDGGIRRPGWITIQTVGTSWRVVVKDPDSEASLQALGQTLDDALVLAEKLVSAENAPWEKDAYLSQKKGRR